MPQKICTILYILRLILEKLYHKRNNFAIDTTQFRTYCHFYSGVLTISRRLSLKRTSSVCTREICQACGVKKRNML